MRHRHAFTLVELSIVLVILGLLVGGVLSGQSLIRAAELRAVGSEFSQYQTALNAFQDKYMAFPGDMPNAVRYWGAADSDTADGNNGTCVYDLPATGTLTCNGDGNRLIDDSYQAALAWQHLSNAALVPGTYAGSYNNTVATNIPASRLSSGYWQFCFQAFCSDTGRNALVFSALVSPDGPDTAAILSPAEAYMIDKKMDDGEPRSGKIAAPGTTIGSTDNEHDCVTDVNGVKHYDPARTEGKGCSLYFYPAQGFVEN